MLTTSLRYLVGGRCPLKRLYVDLLVYVGPGLRDALPFQRLKRIKLLSGML